MKHTVSQVLIPFLYAYSSKGRAFSSFNTHGSTLVSPYPIVPRMIFEIFRPDFPSLYRRQYIPLGGEERYRESYLTYFIAGTGVSFTSSLFTISRSWVDIVKKKGLARLLRL